MKRISDLWRPLAVALCLALPLLQGVGAQAATVLNTGGPQNGIAAISPTGPERAAALVFQVNSDLSNAALSFDIDCITACAGNVFLTKRNVLQGITISSLIQVSVYSGKGTLNPFSGLDLSAGIYSLVMDVQSGFAGWLGSTQPSPVGDGRASIIGAGLSGVNNPAFPPGSAWTALTSYSPGLIITANAVAGTPGPGPAPVPLPAGGLLLAAALALVAAARRRRARP
jgi:hypothetical protein